jgi:hypothetical protein
MKGLVLSFEKGEDHTCTFAVVHLCNKTLQVFNFEISDKLDEEVEEYSPTISHPPGMPLKWHSDMIQSFFTSILKKRDIFFVRNTQTLNILTSVFEVAKEKVYVVNKPLNDMYGLRCVACGDHTRNCSVFDVIAITNFICNQNNDTLPKHLVIADAGTCFKFDAL